MYNFTKKISAVISTIAIIGFAAVNPKAQCNAAFSYVINAPYVTFTAQDSTPGQGHMWYFGDGQDNSYWYSLIHTYNTPGQYRVTHIIFDSVNNCVDSSTRVIQVNFTSTCQAAFSYYASGDSLISGNYYFTSNSSATGGASSIESYAWTVNGVQTDSSSYPFYSGSFPVAGSYNVCLSIQTYAGCASQSCEPVTVYALCNLSPAFTYTTDTLFPPTVTFSPNPIISGFKYAWRINGSFTSQQQPFQQFYQPGTYPVTLFMIDTTDKCFDSTAGTFTVPGVLCDSVHVSFSSQMANNNPSLVYFTAQSNDVILSQSWQINSVYDSLLNITLNTNNPSYQFADTGYYQICLTAFTKHCLSVETCNTVQIAGGGDTLNMVHAYPNPATNMVGIDVPLEANAAINVNIYNESGTKVITLQTQGAQGNNHIDIPVMRLTKGQYFVDITAGSNKRRSVFQKN